MSRVAVVTDSTAYIPQDLLKQYNISVGPQVLIWGEETYNDGVDIQPDEFYKRLAKARIMPTTSQVTIASFKNIFEDLQEQDYEIIAILLSKQLSGTIASALQAREMVAKHPIEIIDSRTTAMALGFQVLTVARAAQEGATLAECKALAEEARDHVGVVFAVNTLEFLHRGGRIGSGTRYLGSALNIKPILEVRGGHVEAVERVRTRKKSLNRLLDMVSERIAGRQPVHIATLHANAEEEAQATLKLAEARFHPVESVISQVSPVVGTHAGPGTVALAFMAGI